MRVINSRLSAFILLAVLTVPVIVDAADRDAADNAVAGILFEYEGVAQYATYSVDDRGFVEITFPQDIPEDLYGEIRQRLRGHSAIDGVLASKGGPACGLW